MFDDLIEEKTEKPATPYCVHRLFQENCPDFVDSDDQKIRICKHFGPMTSHCYKGVDNV